MFAHVVTLLLKVQQHVGADAFARARAAVGEEGGGGHMLRDGTGQQTTSIKQQASTPSPQPPNPPLQSLIDKLYAEIAAHVHDVQLLQKQVRCKHPKRQALNPKS
jgi:hypothetical protein